MKTLAELRAQFPQYDSIGDGDFLMAVNRKLYPDVHPRRFLNAIEGGQNAHATIQNPELRDWYRAEVQKPLPDETAEQTQRRLVGSASPVVDEGGRLGTAARSGLQGLTFGAGDEIVAAGIAAIDPNRDYDDALAEERARLAIGRDQHGGVALASEIGGAVAVPAAAWNAGKGLLGRLALSGASGAAQGAAYGFGTGEGGVDNRLGNARDAGIIGGVFGLAAPAVGALASRGYNGVASNRAVKAAARTAPSLDELKSRANSLYAQADQVTNLPRAELAQRMPGVLDDALRGGMDEVLTPGASRVAGQIDELAQSPAANVTFRDLDIMRKRAGIPAGNTANKTEQAVAMRLIDALDEYVDDVSPRLSGVAKEARDTWARMSRAQKVADAIEVSDAYLGGASSGMRNQVASLLRNPKRSRGFNEVEKAALKKIANPGVVENLVHYAGGGLGQHLSQAVGATLGGSVGQIPGGLAGAAVGAGMGASARKLSEAITARKADQAMRIIASGGQVSLQKMEPEVRKLVEALFLDAARPVAGRLAEALRQ